MKDHPLIAIGKARFVGEPVAAVIAEDELTAQEALKDVAVEYEELTSILDVDTALAPGAPAIHENSYVRGAFPGSTISRWGRATSAKQCTSSGAT